MIADGELTPDTYRVTLDDGSSADYQLAGVVHSDTGDSIVYQPDEQAEALAGDFRIPLGRVQFICSEGELLYFPSNRMADAEPVSDERRVELTYAYLQDSPYTAPVKYEMTPEQEAALFTVLGLHAAEEPLEEPQSPENPPAGAEGENDTADPKPAAPGDLVESMPEQTINLESGQPSATLETPPPPSPESQPDQSPPSKDESPTSDQPAKPRRSSPPATAASPAPETPSPSDEAATPAKPSVDDPLTSAEANPTPEQQAANEADPTGTGPGDHAKATETLIVNVEDEPPE